MINFFKNVKTNEQRNCCTEQILDDITELYTITFLDTHQSLIDKKD